MLKRLLFIARMAARELRRGRRRFVFFLLCIAIGVSSLVGVKGFNANMQTALFREARSLIAADLKVSLRTPPRVDQAIVFQRLRDQGVKTVYITETISMASAPATGSSVLAEVKAVGEGYPFYGTLVVDPPVAATDDTALVSADLLDQLGLKLGDEVKVGYAQFRIAGLILREPDRITAGLGLAPRVMITHGGMERANLIQTGSLANHIFLFKLASEEQMTSVRRQLGQALRGSRPSITDFGNAQPQVRRILDRMTTFLSLLSMVTLLVGGLGVANATRLFINEKLDAIAIMKCLGAPNRRVTAVYMTQVVLLGLAGSLLGIAIGYGLQLALPGAVGSLLNLTMAITLDPLVALQGLAVGVATSVLFALLPLTAIAGVKPALVFRREMRDQRPRPSLRSRIMQGVLLAAIGAGLVILSAWVSGSRSWALSLMGGLAGAVVALAGAAWVAVGLVRRIRVPRAWLAIRQGLGNVHRPGSQALAIIAALGIGVTVVLSVILVQRSLLREIEAASPRGTPNMIFSNIQHAEVEAFHDLVRQSPGVTEAPEPLAQVRGRLLTVDGKNRSQLDFAPEGGRWFNQSSMTQARFQPEGAQMVAGRWWTPADYAAGTHLVSVREDTAQHLNLTVGSVLELDASAGVVIRAQVFNIRREGDVRGIGSGGDFILSPGALDAVSPVYLGQARVSPEAASDLQREVVTRFPSITVINVGQILENLQPVLDRIGLIIQVVAGFSVGAGLIILASSVAATRFRRIRESVIYKTLGATRRRVWQIFAVEYAALGLVAGAVGAVLSLVPTWAVVTQLMELEFQWDLAPLGAAVIATAALTVLVGVLATVGVLRAKPLQVLREE